jgi:hypothetical protein
VRTDTPARRAVSLGESRTTTDFLDAELKGQSPAWFSLDMATRPDLASFQ